MNHVRLVIYIILLVVATIFGLQLRQTATDEQAGQQTSGSTLPVNFFIPERFWSGVEDAKLTRPQGKMIAVLVPHHLLAGKLISEMFLSLQAQGVKNIIVVGPNHHELGNDNIQYNSSNWQTEVGRVHGSRMVEYTVDTASEIITNEHSIAGLMPYIAHYTPNAKVFSIIFKHNTKDIELAMLTKSIVAAWSPGTVLLVSVDFSHYLPPEVARQRDHYTREVLLSMNEQTLYKLNNDYMDSPPSAALMMKVCKKLGSQTFIIQNHVNSADILHNPYLQSTTSYFTGYCVT